MAKNFSVKEHKAAKLLSISHDELIVMRMRHMGPEFTAYAGDYFYEPRVLKAWLKSKRMSYMQLLQEDAEALECGFTITR